LTLGINNHQEPFCACKCLLKESKGTIYNDVLYVDGLLLNIVGIVSPFCWIPQLDEFDGVEKPSQLASRLELHCRPSSNTRSHGGRPLSVRGAGMALESSRSTESPSCYTKRELAASLMETGSLSLVKLIV